MLTRWFASAVLNAMLARRRQHAQLLQAPWIGGHEPDGRIEKAPYAGHRRDRPRHPVGLL